MGKSAVFHVTEANFENGGKHVNAVGMSWFKAAIFIVADMMGAGMVALPEKLGQAGLLSGIILLVLGAFFSGFTGIQLAQNWTIMQRKWTEYRQHCRRPYPEMAYRAYAMDICLAITLYGIVTVFILFSANNISILLEDLFSWRVNFCILILVVAIVVWPFTLLKSPMHFWQAGAISAVASSIAAALIIFGIIHDAPICHQNVDYPKFSWANLFLAYGTIVFAYGGHSCFPTVQHDMKKPSQFSRSVVVSYIFILTIYLIISILGFEVYGDSMRESIMPSLQLKWVAVVVNILITFHVMPAIILIFSPLAQQIEEWLKTPHALLKVGGSTVTLMTMLLPSIFWLYLNTIDKLGKTTTPSISEIIEVTPKWLLVLNIVSLLFGLIGGIVSTVTAVSELFSSEMAAPCYVQWFRGGNSTNNSILGATHCCGKYRNITVGGQDPLKFCLL